MIFTATITKICSQKRYYELTTHGGETVLLFFEELGGRRFILGDILIYDALLTKEFGVCALNPIKTGNIHFDKLKECLETKESIKAYVYNRNEGGYEISYNGYRCFLPNCECRYNDYNKESDELMDGFHDFTVIAVDDREVILSIKATLINEHEQLKKDEVNSLQVGFQYMGQVISVEGYGLFVTYKHTEGLLHVCNIFDAYDKSMSNVQKNAIAKRMKDVFLNEEKILVTVCDIRDGQYSLDWDKNSEPNRAKWEQLMCGE
jgi:predicted RNA-binding protein with RPS1 domain